MLDLILIVVFGVTSFRLIAAISRESAVLAEFHQPKTLAFAVALFPLGPLVLLLSPAIPLPFLVTVSVASACYVPALLIARKQDHALQSAGTDRVKPARSAIEHSFAASLAGLLYVVVVAVFALGIGSIRSIGQGA